MAILGLALGFVLGLRQGVVIRREAQADTVHAMALVRRRPEPFALEDVAEVPATVGAYDLRAQHAKGAVLVPRHGAGDAVEIGRPSAAGLELVVGPVQGRVAAGAAVHALAGVVLVVLPSPRGLCSLLTENTELL